MDKAERVTVMQKVKTLSEQLRQKHDERAINASKEAAILAKEELKAAGLGTGYGLDQDGTLAVVKFIEQDILKYIETDQLCYIFTDLYVVRSRCVNKITRQQIYEIIEDFPFWKRKNVSDLTWTHYTHGLSHNISTLFKRENPEFSSDVSSKMSIHICRHTHVITIKLAL